MNTSAENLTKVGIALAVVFGVYKFAPNAAVKAAALGMGGVILGKQIPFVKEAL